MEKEPTPLQCRAKRHMPAAIFVTYDTMLALGKSDDKAFREKAIVECYAKQTTIANYSNQSVETVRSHSKWLVKHGWLIPLDQFGSHGSNRYRVIEHDDHEDVPEGCPPYHYDPDTGKPIGTGEMPLSFWVNRLRQLHSLWEFGFDFIKGKGYFRPAPQQREAPNVDQHREVPSIDNTKNEVSTPGSSRNQHREAPGTSTPGSSRNQHREAPDINVGKPPALFGIKPVDEHVRRHSVVQPLPRPATSSHGSEQACGSSGGPDDGSCNLYMSLPPWVRRIWKMKNPDYTLGVLGQRDVDRFNELLFEFGEDDNEPERLVAIAWYLYVFDEQPQYHLEAVTHVDSGVRKDTGKEWAREVEDESQITKFPFLSFFGVRATYAEEVRDLLSRLRNHKLTADDRAILANVEKAFNGDVQ